MSVKLEQLAITKKGVSQMKQQAMQWNTFLAAGLLLGCILPIGCGSGLGPALGGGSATGVSNPSVTVSGKVHGGQQPVIGATIQLYAVSHSGYGSASTPLISSLIKTDASGSFNITGAYTCPAGAEVYLTATGGNPGMSAGTNNASLAMLAALGPCTSLTSNSSILVNELTTVGSVWALQRFISSPTAVGTSATNAAGLTAAFAAVNKVVDVFRGTVPGPALPANATAPSTTVNALANILAMCVNSGGGQAGDGSPCGNLFAAATPAGGTAPSDTIAAAINIAKDPAHNAASLFYLLSPSSPFQPMLTAAPNNWMIGITYKGGGLSAPSSVAVDSTGNVWLANKGNNSVTKLNNTGAPLSPSSGFTGGGLSSPSALAVDQSGFVWIANSGNNSVSKFNAAGDAASAAQYTGAGLSNPQALSIDSSGNAWVANAGNSSVSEFSSSGTALSPATGFTGGGINRPSSITIKAN